ncbi:formyl transferase domain protein [Chloroherpeton thalassium ATCC 35110]|uniref:Formyl transferase domain protein n=1 Tax=Chloroherpeton thalassium (strain ATCC 35110 / GB-78) TaxID=517418 RepID=B3QVK2_CHLT3|nr:formyltransferase family protein [Chloroherpeton thalassium]ACF14602.1 formyl transferase domain protein [Chloroherpeton thalassium ATCC 35110]
MKDYKIVVIGAVKSTERILNGLLRNNINVVGVLGLDRSVSRKVSGYVDLGALCQVENVPYKSFININDDENIKWVRNLKPDYMFAVGFSQLLKHDILAIPQFGTIGFHPTKLPKGRGRAPLAWLTYNAEDGAASFFLMTDGADSGDIFVQEPFTVDKDDHAFHVEEKILSAIDKGLDKWLPLFKDGRTKPVPQCDEQASYTGIRREIDGLIDWEEPGDMTYARIRAASKPHPGAYTFANGRKLLIWEAAMIDRCNFWGAPGRVLEDVADGYLVQAGDKVLKLLQMEYFDNPKETVSLKVGQLLGYRPQQEIHKMYQEINALKKKIEELKK